MTTTNNQLELEVRTYTAKDETSLFDGAISDPALRRVLVDGNNQHGRKFLAFMLAVDVTLLPIDEIISISSDSHLLQATSYEYAMQGLSYHWGFGHGVRASQGQATGVVVDPLPGTNSVHIQELMAATHFLVNLADEWHVFDRSVIEKQLNC